MITKALEILASATLTGLIMYVASLSNKIEKIENTQVASKVHIYRIEQNEMKIRELQEREK